MKEVYMLNALSHNHMHYHLHHLLPWCGGKLGVRVYETRLIIDLVHLEDNTLKRPKLDTVMIIDMSQMKLPLPITWMELREGTSIKCHNFYVGFCNIVRVKSDRFTTLINHKNIVFYT